jgi:hypothetical protein
MTHITGRSHVEAPGAGPAEVVTARPAGITLASGSASSSTRACCRCRRAPAARQGTEARTSCGYSRPRVSDGGLAPERAIARAASLRHSQRRTRAPGTRRNLRRDGAGSGWTSLSRPCGADEQTGRGGFPRAELAELAWVRDMSGAWRHAGRLRLGPKRGMVSPPVLPRPSRSVSEEFGRALTGKGS